MNKILIIEDDEAIAEIEKDYLENCGYEADIVYDGETGLKIGLDGNYSLILLDLMLPKMDGFTVCRRLREKLDIPILMVTARQEDIDKIKGLGLGADDYITKPFGTSELLARIRASLRHSNRLNTDSPLYKRPFHAKGLTIDFEKHLVSVDGKDVHLTQIEFKIISLLAQNSGRVMTYDTIISNIWGPYADDDNSILRVNMAHIRRKLEQNPADRSMCLRRSGLGIG